MTIGYSSPGTVTNGGLVLINGTLDIGSSDNTSGVLINLSSGNITVGSFTQIGGFGANATGTFTNSGIFTFYDVVTIGDGFSSSNGIATNNNTILGSEVRINSNGQLLLNPASKTNIDLLLT